MMTDEEFEKELDKMYEEIDQKQAEMEELGLIMYGDTGYYWRNPEEYEKDKKICELESKIERLEYLLENKKIEYTDTINFVETSEPDIVANELDRLNEQLAEKEKEIKKLKQLVKAIDTYNQYSNDAKNLIILDPERYYTDGHKLIIKTDKQNKIDYAVEQLERVKEIIDIYVNNLDDGIDCIWAIDQLIAEIKEGK